MQLTKQRKAVPFIIKNEQTNQYELTKAAQELLKKVDKNISVVSVAGLYRTGKSYLLNSVILDKKGVFGVGPTVNPCTKGLWLWVQPDPTSEKRSMLVIDTQGLGALDQEANHDMKIFCLAVLLSTTFIYNSVGSIDENALQTLSLVLNLVSTIDQDNISNRPQFIWVVRDFTLQLIDDKGKTLTPAQYLQMALSSPANTKQAQKTSIRKTITSAFQHRDCFTLVKPLIDETKLQNLDQTSMDDLRPQFVSQSIQLKNRIKTTLRQFKLTAKDNNITGKQYVMVVQKYLNAINTGAVPNMVDTWSFIKEEKCREAVEQARKVITQRVKSKIMPKIPTKRSFFEEQFKNLRAEMKAMYLKMTFQQSSTEPVQQLLSNAYGQIIKLNAEESKQCLKNILNKQFEPFLKKLFSQYYNNFEEFQQQISKGFKQSITQKYSDKLDDVKQQTDRFADQKLIQNVKFFEKKFKQQIKNMKVIKDELEISLCKQITQMNQIKQKQRKNHQEKIFDLEKRLRMFENQKEHLMEFGKAEKDLFESNMNLLKKKNQELTHTIQQLNREIASLHSVQNQIKQKSFIEHKESQKQKALFAQKQQFLTIKVKQLQQKCAEMQGKFNQTGGKYQIQKKGIAKQYQQKIQWLDAENKRLTEKLMQTESKLGKLLDDAKEMSEQIQILKQSSMSDKRKLQSKIAEAESSKKPSKIQQDLKQENHELVIQLQKTNEKLHESSKKQKSIQQEMKNLQNNYQKQIAIHIQQIQFQQIELNDFKNRYEQLKKSYQNALQNLHDTSKNQQSNLQLKIYELTADHQKQLKNLEADYQQKIKSLKKQSQMLQRHKQQMALQQSLDKKSLQSKQKQWKQNTNMLQLMVKKLQQKIQSSEKDHEDINKQKQGFYSLRIKQLEQELEEVKEKTEQQILENTRKSQEAFSVLKHYSQVEKQQWEKRLIDEKDKGEKRLKAVRDELEKKIAEQRASLQQYISDLQGRLAHMERVFNQKLQNMQYDHDISTQKITNQFMEEKVQLNKQLALTQQKLQMTRTTFERELNTKIKHYENTIENLKVSLRQEFEENIRRLSQEKQNLENKYEASKKANRQLEQNSLILKNEVDKERAVFKQKQKTFQKRIIQMQNRIQLQLSTYNKTIENINERHSIQIQKLNEQIDKLNINLSSLQQQRDKIETEHENQINRLQSKLKVVQQSKNKSKQDYEDIVNKFQTAVTHFGNQKKKLMQQKQRSMQEINQKTNDSIRQIQQTHRKMMKESQDRIARLVTENKSLKDRIMVIQLERSTAKKPFLDDAEKQRIDRKYEKRIDQYKELYQKQKQKSRKLKQQNARLRMQTQSSNFNNGNSTITYVQRPSFSQISNSRLYNNANNTSQLNMNLNLNTNTEVKRKYTNAPQHRNNGGGFQDRDSSMMMGNGNISGGLSGNNGGYRFNAGTGYKNMRNQ